MFIFVTSDILNNNEMFEYQYFFFAVGIDSEGIGSNDLEIKFYTLNKRLESSRKVWLLKVNLIRY